MTKEAVRAQRPFSNLVLCLQMVLRHLVVEGLVADPSVARSGRWRWEPRLAPAVARMALTRVGLERRGWSRATNASGTRLLLKPV